MKFKEKSFKKFASLSLALMIGTSSIGPFFNISEATTTKSYEGEFLLDSSMGFEINEPYSVKVVVEVDNGKIVNVADNGTEVSALDGSFWRRTLKRYLPKFSNLEITKDNYMEKLNGIDVASGATASSNAVKEAVKIALEKHFSEENKTYSSNQNNANSGSSNQTENPTNTVDSTQGGESTSEKKKIFDIIGAYFRRDRSFSHEVKVLENDDLSSPEVMAKIEKGIRGRVGFRSNKKELSQEDLAELKKLGIEGKNLKDLLGEFSKNYEISNIRINFSTDKPMNSISNAITYDLKLFDGTEINDITITATVMKKLTDGYVGIYDKDTKKAYLKFGNEVKAGDYVSVRVAGAGLPKSYLRDFEVTPEDVKNGFIAIKMPQVIERGQKESRDIKDGDKLIFNVLLGENVMFEDILSTVTSDVKIPVEKVPQKPTPKDNGFSGVVEAKHYMSKFDYFTRLRITVKDGKIESVEDNNTNPKAGSVSYWEIGKESLNSVIGKSYSELNDDLITVSGATWSGHNIIDISKKALVELNEKDKINIKPETSVKEEINKDDKPNDSKNKNHVYVGVKGDTNSSLNIDTTDSNISKIDRISGNDRYDTAVKVSKSYFNQSDNVIIVSGEKEADALVSSSLAGALNAPILLVSENKVPEEVKSELIRLGVKNIIIVGGNSSISSQVEKELAKYNIKRIAGNSRYETSEKVYKKVKSIKNTGKVILASGLNTSDALTAGTIASMGTPILLTEKAMVPKNIEKTIESNINDELIIVGGNESISDKIKFNIEKVTRLSGKDRFETSKSVANFAYPKSETVVVSLGEGNVIADALVSSVVSAKEKAPILLTSKSGLPNSVKEIVKNAKKVKVVGGENSVPGSQFK